MAESLGAQCTTLDHFPFVVDLAQVRAMDIPQVGGKAANLGELLLAGFPTPPGFVVTTSAYDEVVAANGLQDIIESVASAADGTQIRAEFEGAFIPAAIQQAILAAYRALGSGSVAVRSSATAEDLPDAAFAGQQDTFLGIVDDKGLLSAVRKCWASLWSERAIAYRQRQGYAHRDVKLAVVVERLIAADAAGVLFTANPISGARIETVIDASAGLGESIVSGVVTPDHFVLRKGRLGWRIVARKRGRREVEVRPRAGGGTEQVAGDTAAGAAVPDVVLRRLARLGAAVQQHFGRPQDIEWAWADGKLHLLQARPITALPTPEPRRGRLGFPQGGPTEYFQIRPYPLDMTSWLPAMSSAIMRMLPLEGSMPSFDSMIVEEGGVAVRFAAWPTLKLTPAMLLVPLRMAPLAWRYDPAHWREDPLLAHALAQVQELESLDLAALSWPALIETAQAALAIPYDIVELRRRYFPRTLFALGALRLMIGQLGYGDRLGDLLSGIENKTLESNRALEGLATSIRADPALLAIFTNNDAGGLGAALEADAAGRPFLQALRAFLETYGRRETGSPLLVSLPTWRDAPEPVLGILKGLAQAPRTHPDGSHVWEATRDEILTHPIFDLPIVKSAFIGLLSTARRFPPLREDTHFAMTMPLSVLRRTFMEMGNRLTAIRVLEAPEDVFHLRFDELERISRSWPPPTSLSEEIATVARQRKASREALRELPFASPSLRQSPLPTGNALVAGSPGSPGIVEGRVRLVRDPSMFGALLPGEVLVAPYTNPSWTPLFGRAAAVIVDAGSAMSHAAIVAREYGIPAVMGSGDALQRLHDGQYVRVDGTRGLVFPAVEMNQESLSAD